MTNFLLTLAYDGTAYCGFQVQPNGRSVAAAVQDALQAVLGTRPDIKDAAAPMPGPRFGLALNFRAETASRPKNCPWR